MLHLDSASHRRRNATKRPRAARRLLLDRLERRELLAGGVLGDRVTIAPVPVEGKSFTAVVAKFTDADGNTDASKYTASVDWGDGRSSVGTITTDAGGGFDVKGTHAYSQRGVYRVSVKISDTDHDTVTVRTSNVVQDAPLTMTAGDFVPTIRSPLTDEVIAQFTDPNPNAKVTDFVASIDWGDGIKSVGKVVKNASGGFNILGSHTYTAVGPVTIKVQVHDGGPAIKQVNYYAVSNLVSDGKVPADRIDPSFRNPWGLAASSGSPFWVTVNRSGTTAIFDGSGNQIPALMYVNVPGLPGQNGASVPAAGSAPTGIVFNDTTVDPTAFTITSGTASAPAVFLFATQQGTISGWNPDVSPDGSSPSDRAIIAIDQSGAHAVYKGLTLYAIPAGSALAQGQYLFATNFHSGKIEVYDKQFHPVTVPAGAFQDPTMPAGYAPFGIQVLNGNLYVTYAQQGPAKQNDVAGAGHGYVDVYNASGYLVQRLGGGGVQNELNSPWGLAQAPADFGRFSNDILVGNFGDSHVSAFDPTTGAFVGQLTNALGQPLVLNGGQTSGKGLWALRFGNGAKSGPANTLFFTSGINNQNDGLFGSLSAESIGSASNNNDVFVRPRSAPPRPGASVLASAATAAPSGQVGANTNNVSGTDGIKALTTNRFTESRHVVRLTHHVRPWLTILMERKRGG